VTSGNYYSRTVILSEFGALTRTTIVYTALVDGFSSRSCDNSLLRALLRRSQLAIISPDCSPLDSLEDVPRPSLSSAIHRQHCAENWASDSQCELPLNITDTVHDQYVYEGDKSYKERRKTYSWTRLGHSAWHSSRVEKIEYQLRLG